MTHLYNCYNNKQYIVTIAVIITMLWFSSLYAETKNKILHINSYHPGYDWSDGILQGIKQRLQIEDVWFNTHYMDSKRNHDIKQFRQSAYEAMRTIEQFKPDVVIVSDDVAVKYLLQQYYKDSDIPFVFSGVNWDATTYGLPYKNATGMVEVALIPSLVDLLQRHSKGEKIGFIAADTLSEHRNMQFFSRSINKDFDQVVFAGTFEEWKNGILELQETVDTIVIENPVGAKGWNKQSALQFIQENIRIPIGATHIWLAPFALVTIAKIPEEQGWWAAETAIKILRGEDPSRIPIEKNKEGRLLVNLPLAEKLGVVFSEEIMEMAEIITE